MRLVHIDYIKEGSVLAKSILNQQGRPLLQSGVVLRETLIRRLKYSNVSSVYIEDSRTNDIEVKDILSEETRGKAYKAFNRDFHKIADANKVTSMLEAQEITQSFRSTVHSILHDIRSNRHAMAVLMDMNGYDNYTFKHSLNVTFYTLAIAVQHNFNEQQLNILGLGAILHDIGKLCIPEPLLKKDGKLTYGEFDLIKKHTSEGFNMLRKMESIPLLSAHCAYQHHERLNGTGYPRGLYAQDIHIFGKILAIADVFDAMTTNRPYRNAYLPHVALEQIHAGSGTLFDHGLIQIFRENVSMYPIGMEIKLSTGFKGIIVDQNAQMPIRPVVRLLTDEQDNDLVELKEIDLSKELSVSIVECYLL